MGVIVLLAATAFAADTDWFEEGRKFQAQENYAEAIDCFNKAVEESPNDVRAWNRLAVCYFWNGYVEKAVEVSKLTADKWPNNILAANNYAFMASCWAEWSFEKYVDGKMSKEAYVKELNTAITASQYCLDVFNAKPEGFNYTFHDFNNGDISFKERKKQIENEIFRFKVRLNHIEAFDEQ